MERKDLVLAARGEKQLDKVVVGANLVNVFTAEIYRVDFGVLGDRIAIVSAAGTNAMDAKETINAAGKWAVPGFVDTHCHIESSMVTPANFASAVLPFGTTTVFVDPHEIGNVLGMDGVKYMLDASEGLPLRVFVTIPSSVPSVSDLETAGAEFGPREVEAMLKWPRVKAIAEVMDYMGIINANPKMLKIVQAGLDAEVTIQGHSPGVTGRELNAYIAAGVQSDHEIYMPGEILEKCRLGMLPLVRDSTYASAPKGIIEQIKAHPFADFALCTDDIEPADLLHNGHLNRGIRNLISQGIDPALAIRYASLSGARHYYMRDIGAIAPGYLADFVLLSSLEEVTPDEVFVGGKLAAQDGELVESIDDPTPAALLANTVRIPPLSLDQFKLKAPIDEGEVPMNVMVLEPSFSTHLEVMPVPVSHGEVYLERLGKGFCIASIVPRHGQGGEPSVALLKGLVLKEGAIASSVSHDSHNVAVVGQDAGDMLLAVRTIKENGGGFVAVSNGQVRGAVKLPIAGLMSDLSLSKVADELMLFNGILRDLGLQGDSPAMAMTVLALPVFPSIRLTDGGLVDVATQMKLPLFP